MNNFDNETQKDDQMKDEENGSTSPCRVQYNHWYVNELGPNSSLTIYVNAPIFANSQGFKPYESFGRGCKF